MPDYLDQGYQKLLIRQICDQHSSWRRDLERRVQLDRQCFGPVDPHRYLAPDVIVASDALPAVSETQLVAPWSDARLRGWRAAS